MLVVPLIALVGLYTFALVTVAKPVLDLRLADVAKRDVRTPGNAVVAALQAERKAVDMYLAGGRLDPTTLQAAQATSDTAVSKWRRLLSNSELRNNNEVTKRKITETLQALDKMPANRQAAAAAPDRPTARSLYTSTIWAIFALFDALPESVTSEVAKEQAGQTGTARLKDQLSEEDAIIAGLGIARRYTPPDSVALTQLIGAMANQVNQASALFTGDLKDLVDRFVAAKSTQDVYAHNIPMLAKGFNGFVPPTDPTTWEAVYQPALAVLNTFIRALGDDIDRRINDAADVALRNLALTGLGGLLAVVLSLFLTIRLGRSLSIRLAGLRGAALDLADVRLPSVVSRLRRGERVDPALEAPPLDLGNDEIGEVGEAFNRVRRTAIDAAVEEATLRQGINQFFVNIARRSQGLLHRQLALLDSMERRTTEPDDLANLFRVDHLATRMRRHAEDLVILAGNAPGRGWRQPVPMVDVIRGAISEIEDYDRVDLSVVGEDALVGRAVGDIVHMLAELIENGTDYSPPHTKVNVTGQAVGNGFAIEIEDRGLGMTPDAVAVLNRQLLNPPDFNLADSAQLGLFVVARLAAKHGVQVQLRPSLFGGITAIVLLPTELIATGEQLAEAAGSVGRAAVTQQLPAMDPGQHRADDGAESVAHPDADEHAGSNGRGTNGYSRPDDSEQFEWLRRHPEVPPQFEVPLRLAPSVGQQWPAGQPVASAPFQRSAEPAPFQRSAEPAPFQRAAEPVGFRAEAGPDESGTSPTPLGRPRGLPRRVRQASLAPQLRNAAGPTLIAEEDEAPAVSPDLVRSRMSSFQAGTNRGRRAGDALGQEENQ
ncbi:hypothetical protein HC028_14570 [Planosporangium flavigriseum]|nr:nitrate- and nitrite sensing domain-containing protein [Planosporangium flavigriseum]NJC65714.1 hypothetical protein [Planosporangium flavigriseum]